MVFSVSIHVMIRGLTVMPQHVEQAFVFAAENNIKSTVLIETRLAPDMHSLTRKAQREGSDLMSEKQRNAQLLRRLNDVRGTAGAH
jgi:hypothetical protein